MKTVGIVAEFNPFHNGHAYLIRKARENGATHVVAVMSGSFVQRGEPAAFSTLSRAKAAINCGADLVLQLPVVHVLSGAQKFAGSGISILNSCGIVDSVVFGSESGKIDDLYKAAEILGSREVSKITAEELKKGITYAAARENALKTICPGLDGIISEPNNILGVEYITGLIKTGSRMKAETYARTGTGHDSTEISGNFVSASAIRKTAKENGNWENFVPAEAYDILYADMNGNSLSYEKYEAAMLYRMRTAALEEIARLPDISEGLENRIVSSVARASSLEGLYSEIKTKRYTMSRIRRILCCALIGITREDSELLPGYIRVLGLNSRGAELLSAMKTASRVPVISKTADMKGMDADSGRMFELECRATDIRCSFTRESAAPGEEKKSFPYVV